MKNREQQSSKFEADSICRLIAVRLKARLGDEELANAAHPDDDVINAFVEGTLDDRESRALASHLVNCASCLHLTAQLIRLDPAVEEVSSAAVAEEERGPLQRFFDRLTTGIAPSIDEDAVFAYQDNGESNKSDNAEADPKSTETDSD